ncbi:MAG: hypothetical protein K6A32_06625 [Bacteroidales bacterium]|nr:hypothetical protein [Bacteroidales bacterium]
MKKNIIVSLLLALTLGFTFSSCEDMLTGDMDRHVEIDDIAQDTLYSYWGILRSLQNVAERYVILGECRGDMVNGTQYVSDSIHSILEFTAEDGSNRYLKAADFYHIINSCNAYIYRCDTTAVSGMNQPLMLKEYAQVVSIRAWAYLQLVLTYGKVPYFEQPLLSTADMEDFHKAEQFVDASTLASSGVVQKVEEVLYIPPLEREEWDRIIPYIDYGYYGRTTVIAQASQCVFPQDLVLGDIYLLRAQGEGSEADYRTAAQHYYNFLNSDKGGPLLPNTLYGRMAKSMATEQYYNNVDAWSRNIFKSNTKTSATAEVVTVIPSNTNKLWGVVLRGINELFGFDATLSVNTSASDTVTSATVYLERNFEHQLDASPAYKALNKAQSFEAYVGPDGNYHCTVLQGAGDARYEMSTGNYTDYEKGAQDETNFVMKQNVGGGFSTTYPIIYRKASVWLRFAQALNGAGFPTYAFAILRHGLVGSDGWIPTSIEDYPAATSKYYDPTLIVGTDTTFYTSVEEFFTNCLAAGLDTLTTAEDSTAFITAHTATAPLTYSQVPYSGSATCDYISRREMDEAKNYKFLDFGTSYLRGSNSYNTTRIIFGPTEYSMYNTESIINSNGAVSMGIHQRGCGVLKPGEAESTYNYVDQINKMLRLYEPDLVKVMDSDTIDYTIDEIYDPANLRTIQVAIADLIIDEMALETAFEGNRFFDLLCYSRFLGSKGVERFAKRVSERSGSTDGALYSRLQDQRNWYFKLK